MFLGTALSVHVFVYAGLSLFIINGHYLYVVVCILYAYNLTLGFFFNLQKHCIHAYFLGMGRVNLRGRSRVYYTHKFDMFGEPIGKLC